MIGENFLHLTAIKSTDWQNILNNPLDTAQARTSAPFISGPTESLTYGIDMFVEKPWEIRKYFFSSDSLENHFKNNCYSFNNWMLVL